MIAGRPAYPVLVLGADRAPPELVAARLDLFLAPKACDHNLILIPDADGDSVSDWSRTRDCCCVELIPRWPGRLAGVRWAMEAAAQAAACVLFGPDAPHRVVLRYLRDAAVPVRRVPIPAGHVAQARPDRRVPWAFTPAHPDTLLMRAVLDGAGPGGYPD